MKCIVGLGNHDRQYANTRHNIGFRVIDMLLDAFPASDSQADAVAHVYQTTIQDQPVLLVKPQTYMNRSGIAIREVFNRYQVPLLNLVVIYDDLDLEVGRLRIRLKGGHGGHKGVKSIIEHLETNEFVRIRIGIGHPESPGMSPENELREWVVDYVLRPFQQDEQAIINTVMQRVLEAITLIMMNQVNTAMNRYNRSDVTEGG